MQLLSGVERWLFTRKAPKEHPENIADRLECPWFSCYGIHDVVSENMANAAPNPFD